MRFPLLGSILIGLFAVSASSCRFDRSDRWEARPDPSSAAICSPQAMRCTSALERCSDDGTSWVVLDDCLARDLVCAGSLLRCASCEPGRKACDGSTVVGCTDEGEFGEAIESCDDDVGHACRGGACEHLCATARANKSNVGCEYWAVDLDNAVIDASNNAAAQQYAVVVSNPQPDVPARVTIEQDDGQPGGSHETSTIAEATIPPMSLRVFPLGPREVDGSPEGEFNTGTGTALTRNAFRITSHVPVVAYQFNPLENVNVFSNDASLLKPVEALTYAQSDLAPAYVVVGWPQTIAHTDDPRTNFNPRDPIDLRAFVTIVGTRPGTRVRMTTKAKIIPGGPVPLTLPGGVVEVTLDPFDVLNLETGDFNADFTGSLIEADQPVVVFSGSEASDAPYFETLSERFCCADHLEEQLDPIRTAGQRFVLSPMPRRTRAVKQAGASIEEVAEPEYFRVVATTERGATLKTTLPPPNDEIRIEGRGSFHDLTIDADTLLVSSEPVIVASVQASQDAAFVPRGLPGGDPSLLIVPPIEQYRPTYVFLTPDKYAFDFIVVIAPKDARVLLDRQPLDASLCEITDVEGEGFDPQRVYRCQLSFPVIDDSVTPPLLLPGRQNDGVHRIESDRDVGVLVYGFDAYVSYAYAAGTQLEEIAVR